MNKDGLGEARWWRWAVARQLFKLLERYDRSTVELLGIS
jgi:hypothetical protein